MTFFFGVTVRVHSSVILASQVFVLYITVVGVDAVDNPRLLDMT
jgi:hypothetical protein